MRWLFGWLRRRVEPDTVTEDESGCPDLRYTLWKERLEVDYRRVEEVRQDMARAHCPLAVGPCRPDCIHFVRGHVSSGFCPVASADEPFPETPNEITWPRCRLWNSETFRRSL